MRGFKGAIGLMVFALSSISAQSFEAAFPYPGVPELSQMSRPDPQGGPSPMLSPDPKSLASEGRRKRGSIGMGYNFGPVLSRTGLPPAEFEYASLAFLHQLDIKIRWKIYNSFEIECASGCMWFNKKTMSNVSIPEVSTRYALWRVYIFPLTFTPFIVWRGGKVDKYIGFGYGYYISKAVDHEQYYENGAYSTAMRINSWGRGTGYHMSIGIRIHNSQRFLWDFQIHSLAFKTKEFENDFSSQGDWGSINLRVSAPSLRVGIWHAW